METRNKFCHWVTVIATRTSLTYRESINHRTAKQETLGPLNEPSVVIDHDLRECIQSVRKKMSKKEQQVFQLRGDQFSIEEIAKKWAHAKKQSTISLPKSALS